MLDQNASIMQHMITSSPFLVDQQPLTSLIRMDDKDTVVIALDNGNSRAKGAILDQHGKLQTLQVPTAYRQADRIVSGTGTISYVVNEGIQFWVGEEALRRDGPALQVGSTAQRLEDVRQRDFLLAALTELLIVGGYEPGSYDLALGLGIPNDEIRRTTDRLGVSDETKKAIKAHLYNQTFVVRRTNDRDVTDTWTLSLNQIGPQAQTFGSLIAWSHTPTGRNIATDIEAVSIIDIGGGDTQALEAFLTKRAKAGSTYSVSSQRLGDGTIALVRHLQRLYPHLTDAAAHQALLTKKMRKGGKLISIADVLSAEVIPVSGRQVVVSTIPVLKRQSHHVVVIGGGTLALRDIILQQLPTVNRTLDDDIEVVDNNCAAYTNVVGILFATLFAAAAKAAKAHQPSKIAK